MGRKVNKRINTLERQLNALIEENQSLKEKLAEDNELKELIKQVEIDLNKGFYWAFEKATFFNKALGYLGACVWIIADFLIPNLFPDKTELANGLKGIGLPFVFTAAFFEVIHNSLSLFGVESSPLNDRNKVKGFLWLASMIVFSAVAYYFSLKFITNFLINKMT